MINVDGANERHLFTANRPRSPTWTPGGEAIIFERNKSERTCRSSPFGCLTDEELLSLFSSQSCLDYTFWYDLHRRFPADHSRRHRSGALRVGQRRSP